MKSVKNDEGRISAFDPIQIEFVLRIVEENLRWEVFDDLPNKRPKLRRTILRTMFQELG